MLALKFIVNFNKQHELLISQSVTFLICEVDNQLTRTARYKTIAKGFHSLLHNLHSSITKWSISKTTDRLFLFVI